MSLGLAIFTFVHVIISLVGIGAGFVVLFLMLKDKEFWRWTVTFLATTVATSLTGFLFPVHHFMPSHAVGILSLLVLAVAVFAHYRRHLAGAWRRVYVVGAMISLWLNFFVLVAQLFMKVPFLKSLAPTQSEPPFAITQLTVFVIFIGLTVAAAIRFRGQPAAREHFLVPAV
jgi:hypothetical protein